MFLRFFPLLLSATSLAFALRGHECEDYTISDCRNNDFCKVSAVFQAVANPSLCQSFCDILPVTRCNTFDYNSDQGECSLLTCRVIEFDSSCQIQGGPKDFSIADCSLDGPDTCASFRKKDCTYNGPVISATPGILSEEDCQLLCFGTENCNSYSHDLINEECVLQANGPIVCTNIVGPRLPLLSDCQEPPTTTTTSRPTTSAQATTTIPFTTTEGSLVNVFARVFDATTNIGIPDAQVNFYTLNGSAVAGEGFTDESGNLFLAQFVHGQALVVSALKDDYNEVENTFVIQASGSSDQHLPLGLSPIAQGNESRIVMTWNPEPRDLDLHVLQVDRISGAVVCHVYYGHKNCPGFYLDVDNTQGGDAGAETVTISQASDFVFVVYVFDFNPSPSYPMSGSAGTIDIYGLPEGALKIRVPTQEPSPEDFSLLGELKWTGIEPTTSASMA